MEEHSEGSDEDGPLHTEESRPFNWRSKLANKGAFKRMWGRWMQRVRNFLHSNQCVKRFSLYSYRYPSNAVYTVVIIASLLLCLISFWAGTGLLGFATGVYFAFLIVSYLVGIGRYIEAFGYLNTLLLFAITVCFFVATPAFFVALAAGVGLRYLYRYLFERTR
ncbi:hypothetical protein JYU14_01160 [Simkania negevensis]|uniref:Uncharacterized protein n=1 Tax=Simkania negevensis TaxID=83561 RepID=A0ABS3AQV8_9BACT|nr:hypothetical protein [Simkania negevensis]